MTAPDLAISPRAKAIAEGLIRTDRAGKHGVYDQGMLRLKCLLDPAQRLTPAPG